MLRSLLLALLLCVTRGQAAGERPFNQDEQDFLRQCLRRADFSESTIDSLALAERSFLPRAIEINLHTTNSADPYQKFFEDSVITRLAGFLVDQDSLLRAAEQIWGVPPRITGAILMIETRLGAYTGKWNLVDLNLSLQLARLNRVIEQNADSALARELRAGGSAERNALRARISKRAVSRATRSLGELQAFWDVYGGSPDWHLQAGSWAGALGLCQFMPSSLKAYGRDGDGDGAVNLFHLPDAVASMGNYLKQNGWKAGVPPEKQRRVLRRYNHSDAYVDTVIRLGEFAAARASAGAPATP